ncbi:phosphate ABC transporter ATP-binding protein [Veillonella sp. T14073-2]|uniref:phosphate ABC transporter ATP-binding protein n=1 Tax=Veillonella sp. T14073-2 TaxID=1911680 RepID=UPI000CF56147|nr:ATP-binding cassette domain-containing protein [Veillonella sp. T14073-2]PQL23022.1 phosphate ABC transporter ATP-binding protein [Veillonella sp. T14073-2]
MSTILDIKNIEVSIGEHPILQHITLPITECAITAVIGPSGCGKSTLLASLNGSLQAPKKVTNGQIIYDGLSVDSINPQMLRRQIGLIGQHPTVFPGTIEDNMLFALNYYKELSSTDRKAKAIQCLEQAGLYSEINGDVKRLASSLSGGQQQRLCIARSLTVDPRVILFDEPCSALDIKNSLHIEALLTELKAKQTIVIVTHNLQQARRIADYTVFMNDGRVVEWGTTEQIFSNPRDILTKDYLAFCG